MKWKCIKPWKTYKVGDILMDWQMRPIPTPAKRNFQKLEERTSVEVVLEKEVIPDPILETEENTIPVQETVQELMDEVIEDSNEDFNQSVSFSRKLKKKK